MTRLLPFLVAASFMISTTSLLAQDNGNPPAPPNHAKARHGHHKSPPDEARPEPAKAPDVAPWAAIDPDRATGVAPPARDPKAAAVPGVQHTVQPDEDRTSYGVKWSSSSSSTGGQYSTQGVVNTLNRNLGNQNDLGGTEAEAGMKFHF